MYQTDNEIEKQIVEPMVDDAINALTERIDNNIRILEIISSDLANEKQQKRIEKYFSYLMNRASKELPKKPKEKEKSKTPKL